MYLYLGSLGATGRVDLPDEETLPRKIGSLLVYTASFALFSMLMYNGVMPFNTEAAIVLLIMPFLIAYYLYLVSYDLTFVCMHYIRRYRRHKNTEY